MYSGSLLKDEGIVFKSQQTIHVNNNIENSGKSIHANENDEQEQDDAVEEYDSADPLDRICEGHEDEDDEEEEGMY